MESWQQDWFRAFETIANEVSQMFEDIGQDIAEATNALFDFSEEVVDEVEHTLGQIDQMIGPKLDQMDEEMTQWLDPLLQTVLGIEATIDRAVEPVTHTVEPWLNQHSVCMGCRHYHGQEYGGNLLVCAMHPYGMTDDSDTCPDKELVNWSFPTADSRNFPDDFYF